MQLQHNVLSRKELNYVILNGHKVFLVNCSNFLKYHYVWNIRFSLHEKSCFSLVHQRLVFVPQSCYLSLWNALFICNLLFYHNLWPIVLVTNLRGANDIEYSLWTNLDNMKTLMLYIHKNYYVATTLLLLHSNNTFFVT